MAKMGSKIKLKKQYSTEIEGVSITSAEVVIDTVYMFADGRTDVRVRPHQLTMNGAMTFHDGDLTPEQIAIRDAYIDTISNLVQAKMEAKNEN